MYGLNFHISGSRIFARVVRGVASRLERTRSRKPPSTYSLIPDPRLRDGSSHATRMSTARRRLHGHLTPTTDSIMTNDMGRQGKVEGKRKPSKFRSSPEGADEFGETCPWVCRWAPFEPHLRPEPTNNRQLGTSGRAHGLMQPLIGSRLRPSLIGLRVGLCDQRTLTLCDTPRRPCSSVSGR
jgi:hypothetical protein